MQPSYQLLALQHAVEKQAGTLEDIAHVAGNGVRAAQEAGGAIAEDVRRTAEGMRRAYDAGRRNYKEDAKEYLRRAQEALRRRAAQRQKNWVPAQPAGTHPIEKASGYNNLPYTVPSLANLVKDAGIMGDLGHLIGNGVGAVKGFGNWIGDTASNAYNSAKDAVTSAYNTAVDKGKQAWEGMQELGRGAVNRVKGWGQDAVNWVQGGIDDFKREYGAGQQNYKQDAQTYWDKAKGAAEDVAQWSAKHIAPNMPYQPGVTPARPGQAAPQPQAPAPQPQVPTPQQQAPINPWQAAPPYQVPSLGDRAGTGLGLWGPQQPKIDTRQINPEAVKWLQSQTQGSPLNM